MNNSFENGNRISLKDRFITRAENATTIHSVAEKIARVSVFSLFVGIVIGHGELAVPSLTVFMASGITDSITTPGILRNSETTD